MCHMLLSTIQQETVDKYKIREYALKTCGKCDDFEEDKTFNGLTGTCTIKQVCVSRYQLCTLQR